MLPGAIHPVFMSTQPSTVDVSVVIVNYNVREFLAQALRSVQAASEGLVVETWVVDNNSIDGSVDMVRQDHPDVHVIANTENVGFGTANNQAMAQAAGRYILILNPDTILQEDTLTHFVAFMDARPSCGAAGCQILNPDGTFAPESRRSFPTPATAFYRLTGLSRLFPRSPVFGRYNLTHIPRDEECAVDALSGSCMFVRKAAIEESGPFDEDFFMYGEDLDLCFRIQEAGWDIRYSPGTQIIHYKGESTKKGEVRYVRLFYGAMLLFIEKHVGGARSRPLALLLRAGIFLRASMTLARNILGLLARPALDALVVLAIVSAAGVVRFVTTGSTIQPGFFLGVAPAYALATIIGIAVFGGYGRRRHHTMRTALAGTLVGFLSVATLSFFLQNIGFSRLAIAASLPLSALALVGVRLAVAAKRRGARRAVVVGGLEETRRLQRLLSGHPSPPFRVEGFVADADAQGTKAAGPGAASTDASRLGSPSQLRDLVRLRGYTDIVFAARDVPNHSIFALMRTLHDLRVQFRMLADGDEHVVGKSSVAAVSVTSLLSQLQEVVEPRSLASRRFSHLALAATTLAISPVMWPLSRLLRPSSPVRRLMDSLPGLVLVVSGRLDLVGASHGHVGDLPVAWNIRAAVFSVMNTHAPHELDPDDIQRAYWYYATHQTTVMDLEIIMSHLTG